MPKPWYERRLWEITPIRDAFWIVLVVAAAVLAVWVGYELKAIFTPVLIALALAYLFDPIITACNKKWDIPRPAVIAAILFVLAATFIGFGAWVGPKMVDQAKELATMLKNAAVADEGPEWLSDTIEPIRKVAIEVSEDPAKYLADKGGMVLGGTGEAVSKVGEVIGKTTVVLMMIALVPIYFFFFAWNFGPILDYWRQYIPESHRERTVQILRRMDRIVATYFRSRVVIALIMGVMFSVGWAIAGVPYWLLLGMGSGLLSLIPYAAVVGWPLAVGLKWLSVASAPAAALATAGAVGDSAVAEAAAPAFDFVSIVVWPSVVYIVVQAIEGWILTPWIQGKSLDMSVVTVLIVVFVGGSIGGLYGLILCIPIAACIKVLLVELVLPRIKKWAAEN